VGDVQFDAGKKLLGLHRFMGFVNYLGLPSLSMPIGKDSKGMPISVQVLCRPYGRVESLALGLSTRRFAFWFAKRSPIFPLFV
jgi:aspartyl-tRNA(Asn)/glutamyl-tRNA(Gln) amidotransferase subunit A